MTKKLAIVVPIRGRIEHFLKFVPHLRAYFARDVIARDIDYRVIFVEQTYGLPFNRGMMKNIGYSLLKDQIDYVCFHDVDYVPIWADYTWSDRPVGIVWYGAESRPVDPVSPELRVYHRLQHFYGGAVLMSSEHFEAVNGYSNEYWGWGYEDADIKERFNFQGIGMGRRKGTFDPFEHKNEGFTSTGQESPMAMVNKEIFLRYWGADGCACLYDGLSTLSYKVVHRLPVPDQNPERDAIWEIARVQPHIQPSKKHLQLWIQEVYSPVVVSAQ